MPMLLEDLAAESSASNRRVADRLDDEVRILDERRQKAGSLGELRSVAVDSARVTCDLAVSQLPLAEGLMRSALSGLREAPTRASAQRLLFCLSDLLKTCQRLAQAARSLWNATERVGAIPERLDELARAERRFEQLAADVEMALDHSSETWEPTDPDRLAAGLQLAREGKAVPAEEARTWFRRPTR